MAFIDLSSSRLACPVYAILLRIEYRIMVDSAGEKIILWHRIEWDRKGEDDTDSIYVNVHIMRLISSSFYQSINNFSFISDL